MARKPENQEYSEKEIAQRRDAALRVALNTPPKPHEPSGKKKRSPKVRKTSASASAASKR